MAALNRPTTANYVIHEKVSVDTQGACFVTTLIATVCGEEVCRVHGGRSIFFQACSCSRGSACRRLTLTGESGMLSLALSLSLSRRLACCQHHPFSHSLTLSNCIFFGLWALSDNSTSGNRAATTARCHHARRCERAGR